MHVVMSLLQFQVSDHYFSMAWTKHGFIFFKCLSRHVLGQCLWKSCCLLTLPCKTVTIIHIFYSGTMKQGLFTAIVSV